MLFELEVKAILNTLKGFIFARTRLIEVEAEKGVIVGSLIGTGISKGPHKFSLEYPEIEGKVICIARCACGYQVQILQFEGWGGTRELQKRWEDHIGDQ